jgi:predicted phosphodiesterase
MSLGMKTRPERGGGLWKKLWDLLPSRPGRSFDRMMDKLLVRAGWIPEMMDGTGKILHISDTPTCMYGYLARLLRRVNPSAVVHTGDIADDIKLEIYPGEAERYRAAARRMMDILLAPHRKVVVALGNHDKRELLPPLPSRCVICDNVTDIILCGGKFRISHYFEQVSREPAKYNLYGHSMEQTSFFDDEERYFFNGLEKMRLIEPGANIQALRYPSGANAARIARTSRRGP